jgi:hypothetical protein
LIDFHDFGDTLGYDAETIFRERAQQGVTEKFPKENFRVNREMRDEILVYDPFLTKFCAKMASKCRGNSAAI